MYTVCIFYNTKIHIRKLPLFTELYLKLQTMTTAGQCIIQSQFHTTQYFPRQTWTHFHGSILNRTESYSNGTDREYAINIFSNVSALSQVHISIVVYTAVLRVQMWQAAGSWHYFTTQPVLCMRGFAPRTAEQSYCSICYDARVLCCRK